MSLFVPSSQFKKYNSYDFNGRPATDASFRHTFAQAQAPMLLDESGGGGSGGSTVITSFPNTGDGSASNPVTFAPATSCNRTFFYDGLNWQHKRNSGITEVTVGNTATGAAFATLQDALNCSPFVRVVDNVTAGVLSVSTNTLIYVDPGVTLTLTEPISITDTSLTLRGSASIQSSNITFSGNGTLLCNANTRLYFFDCRVVNMRTSSIIETTTGNYGVLKAYHSLFRPGDASEALFGEGGSEIIFLELQDCVVEGPGDGCNTFIAPMDPNASIVHIRGLSIIGRFQNPGRLADTSVNECILSDINVLSPGSSPGNPYSWLTSGVITNFKQALGATFVSLELTGSIVSVVNAYIDSFSIASNNTTLNNIQTTTLGTISLATDNTILSNGIFARSLSVDRDNCKVSNCLCARLTVNRNFAKLENIQCTASASLTSAQNCVLTNVEAAGGFSLAGASFNSFSNCYFPGSAPIDSTSSNNVFVGGVYGKVTIDGRENTFTGVNFTSTFTVGSTGVSTQASNCRVDQVSWDGSDGVLTNLEANSSITLSVATLAPRCIITGCRTGLNGLISGDIDVNLNRDVIISNCLVGLPGSGFLSNIINIIPSVAVPPAVTPLATMITNCKTRVAIAASTANLNCGIF